ILARPRRTKLGSVSGRDLAMWPSVFRPVSPYSAASGSSPIPTLSKTIQMIRSNSAIAKEVYNATYKEQARGIIHRMDGTTDVESDQVILVVRARGEIGRRR